MERLHTLPDDIKRKNEVARILEGIQYRLGSHLLVLVLGNLQPADPARPRFYVGTKYHFSNSL